MLDEFRARHPDVMLESCSSGGLRIDLGLARHVHGFFLSDPDYTEHHLEVLMGAAQAAAAARHPALVAVAVARRLPAAALDWSTLDEDDFDTMLRAAMLHRFGVSIRLPELRPHLRERLAAHVALYRRSLAPLVRDGVLLTADRSATARRARRAALPRCSCPTSPLTPTSSLLFVLGGGARRDTSRRADLTPTAPTP